MNATVESSVICRFSPRTTTSGVVFKKSVTVRCIASSRVDLELGLFTTESAANRRRVRSSWKHGLGTCHDVPLPYTHLTRHDASWWETNMSGWVNTMRLCFSRTRLVTPLHLGPWVLTELLLSLPEGSGRHVMRTHAAHAQLRTETY